MWMSFAFDLEDDAVTLFGLTAECPATLKQPLKIGGYADTQTVDFRKGSHFAITQSVSEQSITESNRLLPKVTDTFQEKLVILQPF